MNDEDLLERLAALEREPRRERWSERAALRLCSLYEAATPAQRQFMRENVRVGRWRSPDLRTLAEGSIREIPAQQRIRLALVLQSIENARHDVRDNLVSIALIYHSAVEVGMDVEGLFRDVAALSAPEMAALLVRFLGRSPADRSLEAFAHRAVRTATGVKYVYLP